MDRVTGNWSKRVRITHLIIGASAALITHPAYAQAAGGYTIVPVSERLTLGRIFADAAPLVQIIMAALVLAAVASVVIWTLGLGKVGKGDAKSLATALGRLRIVRSAGTPLGLFTASLNFLTGFIGLANVRPAPTIAVLAPGLAEASLAVMLGLMASCVAVICERHLEARIRRTAA